MHDLLYWDMWNGGYPEKLWIFYIIQENAMDDLKFFIINNKKIISEIFLRIDKTYLKVRAYIISQ